MNTFVARICIIKKEIYNALFHTKTWMVVIPCSANKEQESFVLFSILPCCWHTVHLICCHQRLFIDRPAALSAVCLSWLGGFWNFGEGGPLCTEEASQHSIFCTASDWSTEYTVLAACSVHNGPPSFYYQYSLSISSLGLSSLWLSQCSFYMIDKEYSTYSCTGHIST